MVLVCPVVFVGDGVMKRVVIVVCEVGLLSVLWCC